MQLSIPDGYFIEDHIVYGDLAKGSVVARGFQMEFPDLTAASDDLRNGLESDIRLMICALPPEERLQLIFTTSSDFERELDRFDSNTLKKNADHIPLICQKVRGELVNRYRARIKDETLIHTSAALYVSTKLDKMSQGGFEDVFSVIKRSFDQRLAFFSMILHSYGGTINLMDDIGHREALTEFWSPGQSRAGLSEADWSRSIDELCRFSDIAPREKAEEGFVLDGFYCGICAFKKFPTLTSVLTMDPFFALTIPNLRVVVNMEPLAVDSEIREETKAFYAHWSNAYPKYGQNAPPDPQALEGLERSKQKIHELLSNKAAPFKAQVLVMAYDSTREGLARRMQAVRAAIGKTGSQPYLPQLPVSAVSFFNQMTPGLGPWNGYDVYSHKIGDLCLSNLWPVGTTPRADLNDADWILDGECNNLVGLTDHIGPDPLHMMINGLTGSGKTSITQTMLGQTAHKKSLIVIIDNGLHYREITKAIDPDCEPIIVSADRKMCFNIFDTDHNVMTPQHLTNATSLVHLIVGKSIDEDKNNLRAALISEAIQSLYVSFYNSWRVKNPQEHLKVCEQLWQSLFCAEATEEQALSMDYNPDTRNMVRDIAFSLWNPNQFPTLSHLQDEMNAQALLGHHPEQYQTLASLLDGWLRTGRYGCFLDGYSNVDLGSKNIKEGDPCKVVYFELGEAGDDLLGVAGFLIMNQVRNHITGMPRALEKQLIIEEMGSFLEAYGSERVIKKAYETYRKYTCQVISIFQQFSSILEANPKAAKAMTGNSSSMILLRNPNRSDIEELSKFIPIPKVMKERIARFPLPNSGAGEDAFAAGVWANLSGADPQFTVFRNYVGPVLYNIIRKNSGAQFKEEEKLVCGKF